MESINKCYLSKSIDVYINRKPKIARPYLVINAEIEYSILVDIMNNLHMLADSIIRC